MTSDKDKTALVLFGCLGLMLTVPLSAMLSGYVLSVMWGWFIVPVFRLPSLDIPHAIGISMIAGLLAKDRNAAREKQDKWWTPIITAFTAPLILLAMGWTVKAFL